MPLPTVISPTVILPGYLAGAIDYREMEKTLIDLGIPAVTVPLVKRDWLPTLGGRSVLPILEMLDRTVQEVRQTYNTEKINLVGHSAGGWISRIYLGEKAYDVHGVLEDRTYIWQAHQFVSTLVTLGTPQTSCERWALKNINFVNLTYPGAFYPQVKYVCVAGKSIFGARKIGSWLAYSSYQLTGGRGDTWGDGITPIEAAHLAGAENLTYENVSHSPRSRGLWYGSAAIVKRWATHLS